MVSIYLSLLLVKRCLPIDGCGKIKYHISSKHQLQWCCIEGAMVQCTYSPSYWCKDFSPGMDVVKYCVTKVFGNHHVVNTLTDLFYWSICLEVFKHCGNLKPSSRWIDECHTGEMQINFVHFSSWLMLLHCFSVWTYQVKKIKWQQVIAKWEL